MKILFIYLLSVLFIISHTFLYAENNESKSLSESEQISNLLTNAVNLYENNPDSSLKLAQYAYSIARKTNDKEDQLRSVKILAKAYLHKSLYGKAIKYYSVSLDIATELNDNREKTFAYNNIGYTYFYVEDTAQSFIFLKKAIEQKKYFSEDSIFAMPYNNLALIYRYKGDIKNAIKYSIMSEKISERYNNKRFQATTLNNLGLLYLDANKYDKAIKSWEESKTISTEINDNSILVFAELNIVYINVSFLNNSNPKYLQKLTKIDSIITNENIFDARDPLYSIYIEYYTSINDYKNALLYTNEYYHYKDSLLKLNNSTKLLELQAKYQLKSTEAENKILKTDNQLQNIKIKKERDFKIFLLLIILIVILALIIVIIRIIKFKRISKELKEKNIEVEKLNTAYKKLNSNLESNIKEKNIELINNIEELKNTKSKISKALDNEKKANSIKDTFLTNVSQEIRTPLNAINGLTQLLEVEITEKDCITTTNYVNGIKQSVNRLLNIFNNIIDFAKIESNDINIELTSCNLSIIISDIYELYKFKANEKNIKFTLDLQETDDIKADKRVFSKVLTEIFDNAIRYTEEGEIIISSKNIENSNDVLIKISDTGSGIEPSIIPHIFDAVSEQDGSSRIYSASGLGLPLTKRLVEIMNGRLEISSKKNKGTTVSIYLKSENKSDITNAISKDKRTEIPDSILKQKEFEILIVEDDIFNQLFLSSLIEKIAIPHIVSNATEAINIIHEKNKDNKEFDLVFMDINLPGNLNGIELMQKIKEKWTVYKQIIFIAQTAYTTKKEKDKILNSGFNDYLSKPINTKELVDKIKIHLLS